MNSSPVQLSPLYWRRANPATPVSELPGDEFKKRKRRGALEWRSTRTEGLEAYGLLDFTGLFHVHLLLIILLNDVS